MLHVVGELVESNVWASSAFYGGGIVFSYFIDAKNNFLSMLVITIEHLLKIIAKRVNRCTIIEIRQNTVILHAICK